MAGESAEDPLVRQSFAIHEAMTAWLRATYPEAPVLSVITACSYEIGRAVGQLSEGCSDREIDGMLDQVRDLLREHIDAYRRGLRR